MTDWYDIAITTAAVIVIAAIIVAVVVAVMDGDDINSDPADVGQGMQTQEGSGLTYWSITIEGMPCVYVKDEKIGSSFAYGYAGLTCDWSKRKQ